MVFNEKVWKKLRNCFNGGFGEKNFNKKGKELEFWEKNETSIAEQLQNDAFPLWLSMNSGFRV